MVLHMMAVRADTEERKRNFEYFVRGLAADFKCLHCREHFQSFIDKHPLSGYYNMKDAAGKDVGMFAWTNKLHNNANRFLGKPQYSLEESYAYFAAQEVGVCTHCGVSESGEKTGGEKRLRFPAAPAQFVSLPSFPPAYPPLAKIAETKPVANLRPLAGGSMPWTENLPREELVQVVPKESGRKGSREREEKKYSETRFASRVGGRN